MVAGGKEYAEITVGRGRVRRAGADAGSVEALRFRHEALLYRGQSDFLRGTLPFITAAIGAGEPTLVILRPDKIDLLRSELNGDVGGVRFADMDVVGANPARIIPAWREFVSEHARPGVFVRGIGEPISEGRTATELVECQRHESLLNVAFQDDPPLRLLCPYDRGTLDQAVIDEARRSHPFVSEDGAPLRSPTYPGVEALAAPFDQPLPPPLGITSTLDFQDGSLAPVRSFVQKHALAAGLGVEATRDFVLAVHEVVANSIRHAGGQGTMTLWPEDGSLICEVRDVGRIEEPLVGRERPEIDQDGGRGLWLANQLCDLVQIRSSPAGNTVRVHIAIR